MSRSSGAKVFSREFFIVFERAALLFMLCAAASTTASAVSPRGQTEPGQTEPGQTEKDRPASKALPTAGAYKIDTVHSFAYFGARHHVVGLVRGRFDKVTGLITVSNDLAACSVDVIIDVSSISTQNTVRDADLLSPEYFDVKKFPTMTYHGRGIRRVSPTSWTMDGSLTMHGVTKVVPLTFNFNGPFTGLEAAAPARMAFHAATAVKRAEFGMGARDNLEELGILTTPDVAIEIDIEADAKSPAQ
jgi:polyisoprenoid-binding protein YceI